MSILGIFYIFYRLFNALSKISNQKSYLEPIAVCDELRPWCRKSSSISSTLASSDFDDRSFNSNSFIRFDIEMDFIVILRPGRDIRNIHGSHCRNTARICSPQNWWRNAKNSSSSIKKIREIYINVLIKSTQKPILSIYLLSNYDFKHSKLYYWMTRAFVRYDITMEIVMNIKMIVSDWGQLSRKKNHPMKMEKNLKP